MKDQNLRQEMHNVIGANLTGILDSENRQLRRGMEHYKNGEYADAILMFSGALLHNPDNQVARQAKRKAYIAQIDGHVNCGRLEIASDIQEYALKFDPTLKKDLAVYQLDSR